MAMTFEGPAAAAVASADGATQSKFVRIGRRRELVRTLALMVGLHALQIPLLLTALGVLHSNAHVGPMVPIRLLLAIDLGCLLTRTFVAFRAWGMVSGRRPRFAVKTRAMRAVVVTSVAASLNFFGDAVLWCVVTDSGFPWWSYLILAAVVASLGGMCTVLWLALTPTDITDEKWASAKPVANHVPTENTSTQIAVPASPEVARQERDPAALPAKIRGEDTIICCSGGGIRAAAFSMGGLQVLTDAGVYETASAVIGVSGGGYSAAAKHVVRWNVTGQPGDEKPGDWKLEPSTLAAFDSASPELHWLRRHTRYVLDGAGTLVNAVLSLAFGIAVNLLLLAVAIGAAGWLLGWLFLTSGRLTTGVVMTPSKPTGVDYGGPWGADWRWVPWLWLLLVGIAIGAFIIEKFAERFDTIDAKLRNALRAASRFGLYGGSALFALLVALPWLVEVITEWVAFSPTAIARLMHEAGMVPDSMCQYLKAREVRACGADSATFVPAVPAAGVTASIIAVASSVVAVLASLNGQSTPDNDGGNAILRFLGRVWVKIKAPVVPYLAVTVVAIVAVSALIRTVGLVVQDGSTISNWTLGLQLTAALIVVRVFTEPNRTSLHHFFRERISDAFFVQRSSATEVSKIDYRLPLRFSQAGPDEAGPRLVACAVANVTDSDLIPSKRNCTPFVFDDAQIGMPDRMLESDFARRASASFEFVADRNFRDATIPAAVAMSAAAFSPLAGRENVRVAPYRVVLALGNARLGVWLPNPMWIDELSLVPRLLGLERVCCTNR